MYRWRRALTISWLPMVMMAAWTQTIPITHYTSDDGLPPYGVWGICQDRLGVMWFACTAGLARYDGSTFTRFDTSAGIVNQSLRCVIQDDAGMIWIGTEEGATRFDGREFVNIGDAEGLGRGTVWSLAADADDNIWCGTRTGGLNRIAPSGITRFTTSHGLPTDYIYTVFIDSQQRIWLGTEAHGVVLVDVQGDDLEILRRFTQDNGLPNPKVHAIAEDVAGNVIIGTYGGGLAMWDERSDRLESLDQSDGLCGNDVYTLLLKRNGELVVGTLDGGITIMGDVEPKTWRHYGREEGLLSDDVYVVFEDREGNLWTGHGHGVSKITTEGFERYSSAEGLVAEAVYSVMVDGPDDVWVTVNGGVSHLERVPGRNRFSITESLTVADGLPSDEVWCALRDTRGRFWLGTSKGLCQIDDAGQVTTFTREDGLVRNYIISMIQDDEHLLWFGTTLGISSYDHETGQFSSLTVDDGYCGGPVHAIAQDAWGRIWFGTYGQGLDIYDDGEMIHFGPENGLPSNSVISVYRDRSDTVWLGTGGAGLIVARCSKAGEIVGFDRVGEAFGLTSATVVTLCEDAAGRFWIGTLDGVFVLDRARMDIDRPQNAVIRVLDKKAGLVGNQTTTSACFSEMSDGSMWIGMNGGVVRCMPGGNLEVGLPPTVLLNTVDIDGVYSLFTPFSITAGELGDRDRFLEEGPYRFTYDENNLRFSYAALSFIDETEVSYQLKLVGFDQNGQQWTDETSVDFKEYTNLHPGRYSFWVRARNPGGDWTEPPTKFHFSIDYPWWQSVWFTVLWVLAAAGAVYGLVKLRVYTLEKRKRDLEELVQERTQELKAAQEDLMEAAHVAGRAEIATSVLHNVGNTVNSVKVSAQVLGSAVQDAHVFKFMDRMLSLLNRHRDDLTAFLTTDPVGQQFPETLVTLLEKIKTRNEKLVEEISSLQEHIDRVQYFLQAQQKHAEGSALWESVDLKKLIIQLIGVQTDTFKMLQIGVSLNLQDIPKVVTQKSKLVAIFIKLLDNACQSLSAVTSDRDKRITVSLKATEDSHVCIEVQDNGIGIPEDELSDLFQRAYAKKQALSLHFCANAMIEMGGTINVHSDGADQGATFVLTLPLKRSGLDCGGGDH